MFDIKLELYFNYNFFYFIYHNHFYNEIFSIKLILKLKLYINK